MRSRGDEGGVGAASHYESNWIEGSHLDDADAYELYARTTTRSLLEASAALSGDVGPTLEELGTGYVQPAGSR